MTFDRIQSFIEREESNFHNTDISGRPDKEKIESCEIFIKDAQFKWDSNSQKPTLENINLEINKGQIIMIVGAVGSGKSTLAQAILGEVTQTQGIRYVRPGKISYVAQVSIYSNYFNTRRKRGYSMPLSKKTFYLVFLLTKTNMQTSSKPLP